MDQSPGSVSCAIHDLQAALKARGYDCGGPGFGPQTRAQIRAALTDGPGWPPTAAQAGL